MNVTFLGVETYSDPSCIFFSEGQEHPPPLQDLPPCLCIRVMCVDEPLLLVLFQVYYDIGQRYDNIESVRSANFTSRPRITTSQAGFRRTEYVRIIHAAFTGLVFVQRIIDLYARRTEAHARATDREE